VTDDLPSIQYPRDGVRADASYTARLTLAPAHAQVLLGPRANAVVRERAERAFVATGAAIAALPLLLIENPEWSELAVGTMLTPALRARPSNAGLWSLLALAPDRVRAAELALRARAAADADADAVWTLARRAFYAADYGLALERLAQLKPEHDERALHALLRAGCLRGLQRASESAAAFREAATASREPRFRAAALRLAELAAAPFAAAAGPWSTRPAAP
jgi:hypothetical protein